MRLLRRGRGLENVEQMQQMPSAHSSRNVFETCCVGRAQDEGANAIAAPHEQFGHDCHKNHHDLALGLLGGAKIHGAAQVQQKPGTDFAVFLMVPHKRRLHACRDVPVNVTHVVMDLIFPQVSQFNASTSLEQQAKNAGFKLEADYKDAQLDVDAAFKTQQGTLDATFKTQQGTLDATAKNQLAAMQTSNANTQANLQIALKTMEQNYDASLKKHLALVQASTSDRDAQLKADELRLKTLLSEVQALSQMATSLLNNLHADAGLRYSVSA